jgi:hypothetical protein
VRYLDALAAFRFGRDRARMNTQAFRNEKKMRLPLRESRLRLTEAQLSQQAHTFQNGPTQGLRSSASIGRSALRSQSLPRGGATSNALLITLMVSNRRQN